MVIEQPKYCKVDNLKKNIIKTEKTGLWWSKDTTGHGGSAYKVYQEKSTHSEWVADADENGQFMPSKHKGDTGKSFLKKSAKVYLSKVKASHD